MLKLLIPIIMLIVGVGGGISAGIAFKPEVEEEAVIEPVEEEIEPTEEDLLAEREYVKLTNQFVIPIVQRGEVDALIVMSLSVEVEPGFRDAVFGREPRIRDVFLKRLFDYSNVGGFQDVFTDVGRLDQLREALLRDAVKVGGEYITDVLILDVAKQTL